MGAGKRRIFFFCVAILALSNLLGGCGVLVNTHYIEVRAKPGTASYYPPTDCSSATSLVKMDVDGNGYVRAYTDYSDLHIEFYFKEGTDFQLQGNELTPLGKWPIPVGRHLELERFSDIWPPTTAFHVHSSPGSTYYTKVSDLPILDGLEEGERNKSVPRQMTFEAQMPEIRVNGKLVKLPTLSFEPRNITYFKWPCLK